MSVLFAALFLLCTRAHALTCAEVESLLDRGAAPEVVRAHIGRVYASDALERCVDTWERAHGEGRSPEAPTLDTDLVTTVWMDAQDRRVAGSALTAAGALGIVGSLAATGVVAMNDVGNAMGCAGSLGARCGGGGSARAAIATGAVSTVVLGTGIGLKISGRRNRNEKRRR